MHATQKAKRTVRRSPEAPDTLLRRHFADPKVAWSVGTWGGIGEFSFEHDEPCAGDAGSLTMVTSRGGLRLTPQDDMVALEIRRADRDSVHEIAFCLPTDRIGTTRGTVLDEIGADAAALRPTDRDHILFDLGLGAAHIDGFVRIAPDAAALLAAMRTACGKALFDPSHAAAVAVRAASPPRIFRSPVASLEVFAPIPPQGGRSPEGPHSHILPSLLARRRAHGPVSPIPEGWFCCLSLYPGNGEA